MIVMKFGGSSVAGAEKIRGVAAIVKSHLAQKPVVVSSAFRGITDELFRLAQDARMGDVSRLQSVIKIHEMAARELGVSKDVLEPCFDELSAVVGKITLTNKIEPRMLDLATSFGERLSTRIIAAAFVNAGISAKQIDASKAGLITNDHFGAAEPLPECEKELKKSLLGIEGVPVVTGYIGRTKSGDITTMGRNSSDFSAAIIGAALGADEIQIWSDTDGIMTADPRLVPAAKPIETLSFDEACELAYYGGKVLHPHTLVPAMSKNIPVRVLNTFKPEHPGTRIIAQAGKSDSVVKSIAFKRRQSIVSVASPRMMAGPGFLARIFSVFARHQINVDMVSTSEVTVSATTDSERNLDSTAAELSGEFQVRVERDKAIICVVGDGLGATLGIAGDVFSAIKEAKLNVLMISQGASKNNIAFAVNNEDVPKAVAILHRRFFER